MSEPRCGRESQQSNYAPCTRRWSHAGPCAHPLKEEKVAKLNASGALPAVGDVVRLKCGGPPMVVSSVDWDDDQPIQCEWFSSDGEHHCESFIAEILVAAPPLGR